MAKRRSGRPAGNPARRREAPEVATVAEVATHSSPDRSLEELAGYVADRHELDGLIDDSVRAARAQGATWTALARVLRVSPQAVQKRYGRGT